MKKMHIVAILVIAIAIGAIISTAGDASTYVTFNDAKEMAKNGNTDKVHVVGSLPKNKNGEIVGMNYQPELDANFFSFMLVDTNKTKMEVIYFKPKPQDFERSEKIVIVGNVKNNQFIAEQILMKCPSKYSEREVK